MNPTGPESGDGAPSTTNTQRKRGGWFKCPNVIVDWFPNLSHMELRLVLAMLHVQAWSTDDLCYAGQRRLAQLVGITSTRPVQKAIHRLKKLGLVKTVIRGGGKQRAHRRIVIRPLVSCQSDDPNPSSDTDTGVSCNLTDGVSLNSDAGVSSNSDAHPSSNPDRAYKDIPTKTERIKKKKETTTTSRAENTADGEGSFRESIRGELKLIGIRGRKLAELTAHPRIGFWQIRLALYKAGDGMASGNVNNHHGLFVRLLELYLNEEPAVAPDDDEKASMCMMRLATRKTDGRFYPCVLPDKPWEVQP